MNHREAVISLMRDLVDAEPAAAVQPLAEMFCTLDDDEQAKFFVAVAAEMASWGFTKQCNQTYFIGRHLATCECSTEEARRFVISLAEAIQQ